MFQKIQREEGESEDKRMSDKVLCCVHEKVDVVAMDVVVISDQESMCLRES
jgi:hypothetical protein